jgi:hypothetical protein
MPTLSLGPEDNSRTHSVNERDPVTLVLGIVCGVLAIAVAALGWIVLHPKSAVQVVSAPPQQSVAPNQSQAIPPQQTLPSRSAIPQPTSGGYAAPAGEFLPLPGRRSTSATPNGGFPSTRPSRPFRGFTGRAPQYNASPQPPAVNSSIPPGVGYLTREQLAAQAAEQQQILQQQQSASGVPGNRTSPIGLPQHHQGGILTDADIEIKSTYKIQNHSEFVFDGNVTNIGDAPASVVEVWARFSSWTAYPPGTPLNQNGLAGAGADKLFDNAFRLQLVETFRRLKPSESRPLKTVVHAYNARDVQGLPQGWNAYFGPYQANLFARVRQ